MGKGAGVGVGVGAGCRRILTRFVCRFQLVFNILIKGKKKKKLFFF